MTPQERLSRYDSLNTKMTALLNEHRDILGPEQDEDGVPCNCPSDPCACTVPEGYMTTEWIVVSNWTDLGSADGSSRINHDWMHTEASLGMRRSQIAGLLLGALDGARGLR